MRRLLLTAAAVAVTTGLGVAGALAGNIPAPTPGVPVYGELPAAAPANFPPPANPPPGFHYEWQYGYDHHAVYKGHWEPVRNNS
jgi:hypothetical protein